MKQPSLRTPLLISPRHAVTWKSGLIRLADILPRQTQSPVVSVAPVLRKTERCRLEEDRGFQADGILICSRCRPRHAESRFTSQGICQGVFPPLRQTECPACPPLLTGRPRTSPRVLISASENRVCFSFAERTFVAYTALFIQLIPSHSSHILT